MRHLLFALMLSSAVFCVADDKPAAAPAAPTAPKPSDATVTFKVDGMDCNMCAKTVAGIYSKLNGVADVATDTDKGTVVIKYDSKAINEAALLTALKEKPKYTVTKPEAK